MEDMLIGVTDRSILVFIPDPASTTGAGKTGLAAAAITVTYTRVETDNDVVHSDVTSSLSDLSALTDTHADWGWKEVSSTLSKGLYRLDLADAVFASGAWYAVVQVTITSGTAAATPKAFRLISRNDLTDVSQTGDGTTDTAGVTTLLSRLSSTRAGYLDNLSAGAVALAATFTGITSLGQWLGLLAGKQSGNSTARTEVRATGAGSGTFDETTDSQEALRDNMGTAQTGDNYARLGAPAGASVSADVAAVKSDTGTALTRLGTPSNLGGGATVAANLSDIEGQTDDIGTAGAGLTAVPWNASWDAEVQSEVTDALSAMFEAARTEPGQGAPVVNATALAKLDYLYKFLRNKITQTSTTLSVFADDGSTVDHKSTSSDDGTTYTRGEIVTGP